MGGRVEGQLWRGAALTATAEQGYADEAVGEAYEEVHGLLSSITESVGVQPEIFPAYYGAWTYYFVRGDLARAGSYVDDCLAAAELSGEPDDRAHRQLLRWIPANVRRTTRRSQESC